MADEPEVLALFPLEAVLLPGMSLPLHIFEPRYKLLIGECLRDGSPFGVVLDSAGTRADVGCSARIVRLLTRYPDGRMDILSEGVRRFRIHETDEILPYARGRVTWIDDQPSETGAVRERAIDLYRRTFWAHSQGIGPSLVAAAANASYVMASSSLLDLADRQRLLEMESERDRLQALIAALEEFEPTARHVGGNGHLR